jgi:general secretion pathway protein G
MSDQVEIKISVSKKRMVRPGFLVALLIFLSCLAGLYLYVVLLERSRPPSLVKTQIRRIEQTLQLYYLDNGLYPTTSQGLQALVERPTTEPIPSNYKTGGYLIKLPKDPWGNDFIYFNTNMKILILSFGRDGKPGGEGDDADVDNLSCE